MFLRKAFLTVIAVGSILLIACGKKSVEEESSGPVTLSYWTLFGGGDGENMDAIIAAFNESQDDSRVEALLLEWAEYYTKLETGISAGKAPDIGISHVSRLPEMIEQGLVEAIPTELSDTANIEWNNFNQNIIESTIYEGVHYAVPIDTHPNVLYYNKDLLSQAGLLDTQGKPDLGNGKEGFLNALETLRQSLPEGTFALSVPGDAGASRWYYGMYKQLGGGDFVDETGQYQFNKTMASEALALYQDMFRNGYSPEALDGEGYTRLFQRGEAALMYNGVWTTALLSRTDGLNFAAVPVPTIFEIPGGWGDSHSLILPISDKPDESRQIEALKFMNYVAASGDIWAQAGHIPAYTPATKTELFTSLPYVKQYMEAADRVFFEPYHPKNWSIRNILGEETSALFVGQNAGIGETVDNIDAALREIVE